MILTLPFPIWAPHHSPCGDHSTAPHSGGPARSLSCLSLTFQCTFSFSFTFSPRSTFPSHHSPSRFLSLVSFVTFYFRLFLPLHFRCSISFRCLQAHRFTYLWVIPRLGLLISSLHMLFIDQSDDYSLTDHLHSFILFPFDPSFIHSYVRS